MLCHNDSSYVAGWTCSLLTVGPELIPKLFVRAIKAVIDVSVMPIDGTAMRPRSSWIAANMLTRTRFSLPGNSLGLGLPGHVCPFFEILQPK